MNHKVNTIHNHGWLIQEQPTPKQWVRLLRKYLSVLDWPIYGRFPIIYQRENGWNKNWAFYSCIQYFSIYAIDNLDEKSYSLYSYMAIFNSKDPQPGASQETSGSKVADGNGSIESIWIVLGKSTANPWDFPNMGTKTYENIIIFGGFFWICS